MSRRKWPDTVDIYQLSEILGISTRALRDYRARGVLVPAAERGQFMFLPSVQAYAAHLRQVAERDGGKDDALTKVRIESETVKRQIAEITLAKMADRFLTNDQAAAEWKRLAGILREGVMGIPGKASAALPRLTPHDVDMLGLLAREALTMCAEDAEGVVGADPALLLPETAGVSP
jgi:phage terminase Nu1 subunit (DNA packaging protein)